MSSQAFKHIPSMVTTRSQKRTFSSSSLIHAGNTFDSIPDDSPVSKKPKPNPMPIQMPMPMPIPYPNNMTYSVSIPMSVMLEAPPIPIIQVQAPPIPMEDEPVVVQEPIIQPISDLPDLPQPKYGNPIINDPGGFRLTHYWLKDYVMVGYIRKNDIIKKEVGLAVSVLLDKLEDATLDHIHHRRLRRYLVESKKRSEEQMERSRLVRERINQRRIREVRDAIQGQNSPDGAIPAIPIGEPIGEPLVAPMGRMVGCPILQMGYANIQCDEKMPKSKVLEHLAGHVATLMKRVRELEQDVEGMRKGAMVDLDV